MEKKRRKTIIFFLKLWNSFCNCRASRAILQQHEWRLWKISLKKQTIKSHWTVKFFFMFIFFLYFGRTSWHIQDRVSSWGMHNKRPLYPSLYSRSFEALRHGHNGVKQPHDSNIQFTSSYYFFFSLNDFLSPAFYSWFVGGLW